LTGLERNLCKVEENVKRQSFESQSSNKLI